MVALDNVFLVPEPTARSAVPGVSPGRGLLIPVPTARSAVPGVSPGRGLLILFCISGVESRCS